MNTKEFWQLVNEIDWPGLVDAEAAGGPDPCETAKRFLLKRFPTWNENKEFHDIYDGFSNRLYEALDTWSDAKFTADPNWPGFGLGDDGFGDMISHIIGCGEEVYFATLADPNLAVKRSKKAHQRWGNKNSCKPSEGYVEKFSYCFPWKDDYNSPETKLEGVQEALKHWIEESAKYFNEPSNYAHKEVASLLAQIEILSKQIAQGEQSVQLAIPTEEEVQTQIKEARIRSLKLAFSNLAKIKFDTIAKMKDIEDELDTLEE